MAEYAGYRVLLKRLTTPPTTYTMMAQVGDIAGPSIESDQIEVSHRADGTAANMWRRYVAGMKDGGEVTFTLVFDPDEATHDPTLATSIYAQAASGLASGWRLDYPGAAADRTFADFDAYVTGMDFDEPLEDGLTAEVTLKISGPVTWTHSP